ncbi:MAG: dockerin type I domain-containing protein [Candidatus Avispirillum sp.]
MKKVLSLVLVAAMLVCGMAIIPSAQAATLDKYNVAAEAYYFGGEVNFSETLDGGLTWSDAETIKAGDASKGAILLDGKIEDGEWGDPVVHVDSEYAANNGGQTYGKNTAFETPSAENTYYYYTLNSTTKKSNTPKGLNFDLYIMWDEDYLYVAAHVIDNDGYGPAGNAGEDAWDGDAFQFRVDPLGPNSATDGINYNAVGGEETYALPWAGITYTDRHQITHETVGNFIIACTNTYTETFDAALRYDPEEVDYTFKDGSVGTITKYKGTDASYAMYDYGEGIYGSAAYVDTSPNQFSKSCIMDYEVALPWNLVAEDYTAVAGNELGVAAALLNGKPGAGTYNAWLGWGTGICKSQVQYDPQTAGGSNSLTLSATPYTTSRCTHPSFSAATCVAPETCTECGYERGYKTGHDYSYSDVVLPTANAEGSITGTCSVCGDVAVTPIPTSTTEVRYTFSTTDTTIVKTEDGKEEKGFNSGFTATWRKSNDRDADGNRSGELIYNPDGSNKNTFDNTTFPEIGAVLDLYGNGSNIAEVAADVDNEDQAGTYFDLNTWHSRYCYKMDVYFPDLTTDFSDGSTTGHYNPGIRNWFGKDTNFGFYSAGLFKIEDEYYFAVIDARTGDSLDTTKEEFEAAALSYTKATAEDMTTETWHTYAFMFVEDTDANTATAVFAWDGKIVAAASDYHMGYQYNEGTCMFRRYSMGMYLKDVIFGSGDLMNNYVDAGTEPSDTYTVTIDGVATEYAAGETVSLSKEFYVEEGKGYRFAGWSGDTDVLEDASIGVTSFTMPARSITLTSSYVVVGDANSDGKINGTDINFMKRIIAGTYSTSLSMDINGDGSWNGTDANLLKRILSGAYTPAK